MSDASDQRSLFVSGGFDDFGWDPFEFRMLARINRRCNGKEGVTGTFWESVPKLARKLQMSQHVTRRTLQILEESRAIYVVKADPGESKNYKVHDASKWVSLVELQVIREKHTHTKNDRGIRSVTTIKSDKRGASKTKRVPLPKTIDKGLPSEGLPNKVYPVVAVPAKLSDQEWFDSLKSKYKNIDVLYEYDKAGLWTEENGRECDRKFFVNWLNRVRPIDTRSDAARKQTPAEIIAGRDYRDRPTSTSRIRDTAEHLRANYKTEAELRRGGGTGNGRQTAADRIADHADILSQYPTEAELAARANGTDGKRPFNCTVCNDSSWISQKVVGTEYQFVPASCPAECEAVNKNNGENQQ